MPRVVLLTSVCNLIALQDCRSTIEIIIFRDDEFGLAVCSEPDLSKSLLGRLLDCSPLCLERLTDFGRCQHQCCIVHSPLS